MSNLNVNDFMVEEFEYSFQDHETFINEYNIFKMYPNGNGIGVGTANGIEYARLFTHSINLLKATYRLCKLVPDCIEFNLETQPELVSAWVAAISTIDKINGTWNEEKEEEE